MFLPHFIRTHLCSKLQQDAVSSPGIETLPPAIVTSCPQSPPTVTVPSSLLN